MRISILVLEFKGLNTNEYGKLYKPDLPKGDFARLP